ncbi:flagellar protein export ATPase FliI [Halarsenatibacter silvermanii]|uniref:Type 3 secretion system ATPase n=1 Tax=Halarsenatibacter silvermanii TaxID=321763 RepID=A0A1G9MHP4_9FIRM|nr:flagellar protein export ATPase FliI [Halarsenatibacter silvermanii]SDL73613.1 type III secretion system ATPase, FliI/YscN [Halarsenatibacter silvermanii]
MSIIDYDRLKSTLEISDTRRNFGHITRVVGLIIESRGPEVSIGEICLIKNHDRTVRAEVVGFDDNRVLLMPIGDIKGVNPGARVVATGEKFRVKVGEGLLGCVLDGLGRPEMGEIDSRRDLTDVPATRQPPDPLKRQRISEPLSLGIRSIDGLLTCGRGQRIGIFAGSGVGKSTLLGMAARNTEADINVIGLIGERGREVRDFIEKDLGEKGLGKSIIVVATSDEPALVRFKASQVTTAIAEYFRNQGEDVLLMMDSLTRVARALREIGLAVGEPPTTRGYPPSVFNRLPRLLERTGAGEEGTITALYTVLVEGDDFNEPISDTVRAILDGHIDLSRDLASRNHYPAVDVLSSVSRVMKDIVPEEHEESAGELKKLLADYRESEDLINIGAYEKGSNPDVDRAIERIDDINDFLQQDIEEDASYEGTISQLKNIVS